MIASLIAALARAPIVDMRPPAADPIVALMRPQDRCIGQITVSKDGTGDYTTVHEANAAATALKEAARSAETAPVQSFSTPNYRVDIIIAPGVYEEDYITDFNCVAFYAADGGHSTVEIRGPLHRLPGNPSVFEPSGFVYCEGIHIKTNATQGDDGYKYPLHLGNVKTFVFTRGTLTTSAGSAIGSDLGSHVLAILHDVILNGSTNQHGWDLTGQPFPMVAVYSKVTQTTAGGNLGLGGVDGRVDELWVVDSSCMSNINLTGAQGLLHVNNSVARDGVVGIQSSSGGAIIGGATDSRRDWPIPYGGVSDYWRDYLGLPDHGWVRIPAGDR